MSVTVTDTVCPHCSVKHTHATNIEKGGTPPMPGDASMCIACGRWALFDDRRQLRKPTLEEMDDLGRKLDLPAFHRAWEMATRMKSGAL